MKYTIFVLSAVTGTGKTTMANRLLARDKQIRRSVSVTTRPPRAGEIEGASYRFVTSKQFRAWIDADLFLEYSQVYGYWYGVLKEDFFNLIKQQDVLMVIDCQGAAVLKQLYDRVVSVFVLPPDRDVLSNRLKYRGASDELIQKRLAMSNAELDASVTFDYWIVNDDLEAAVDDLVSIVRVERLKTSNQQISHPGLVSSLRS